MKHEREIDYAVEDYVGTARKINAIRQKINGLIDSLNELERELVSLSNAIGNAMDDYGIPYIKVTDDEGNTYEWGTEGYGKDSKSESEC